LTLKTEEQFSLGLQNSNKLICFQSKSIISKTCTVHVCVLSGFTATKPGVCRQQSTCDWPFRLAPMNTDVMVNFMKPCQVKMVAKVRCMHTGRVGARGGKGRPCALCMGILTRSTLHAPVKSQGRAGTL
jgi:hypothetical protein